VRRGSAIALAAARAVHRLLLVLVDRRVRTTYRRDMIATFETASADAMQEGLAPLCRLVVREALDLARARVGGVPPPRRQESAEARRGWPGLRIAGAGEWRQTWRALRRRPGFLAGTVLTLGAGIGVSTATFALVDTVLIKALPYPSADRLVTVYERNPSARDRTSLVAPARLEDWNRLSQSFVAISGSYAENVTDTSGPDPERLNGRRVAPRFFTVFATPPLAGRTFTEAEERAGGPAAAVISEPFWTRRFGRRRDAVGSLLSIGSARVTIVGVMPASFSGAAIDIWLPAQVSPSLMQVREARFFGGIGRLRDGVPLDRAAADLMRVQEALGERYPSTDAGWSAEVTPLKEARVGGTRSGLLLLFGAVAALWLIAVVNVMGLVFVHGRRRAHELAVRAALGAPRLWLAAGLVREAVCLALIGAAAGLAVAAWLLPTVRAAFAATPRIDDLALDGRAAAFAVGSAAAAAVALGAAALGAIVGSPSAPGLRAGARLVAGWHPVQRATVVLQVALSVVLVAAAAWLVRGYQGLTDRPTGVDAAGVVTFHVGARWDEDRARIGRFQVELLQRLEALPHVRAAGMTNFLPATGATLRFQIQVEGVAGTGADNAVTAGGRMVSAGYLRAIRAPLVAGAWCPEPVADLTTPGTAMVNRQFVDRHAPGQMLVGRSLRMVQTPGPMTITGVIDDIAEDGLAAGFTPYVYMCTAAGAWPDPEYVARTADPAVLIADVRRIVKALEPGRAVFGVRSLGDVLDAALERPRRDAALVTLFGGAAVGLAAFALYSLFALLVTERTRELAIRLALGAAPARLRRQVMARSLPLLTSGLMLGLALAAGIDRALRAAVFETGRPSLGVMLAAAVILALVALAAVSIPAMRAARIRPDLTLRM
jgi:predicted permease